ncbi:MAG: pyrroline-5-carboxylate reductase [Actinomycetota bacterium]|jgi:pyrroline-5-carboxylate reductase|nr:pyrroline-5-carboxylate reductase [Actinomycetota bacterium]
MASLPTISMLGVGSMGGAILSGLLASGIEVQGGIRVTNRSRAKAAPLASDVVTAYALEDDPLGNVRAVDGAGIVILGVKPGMVADLLLSIAPTLAPGTIVISIAAGVTTASMEAIAPQAAVVRAMPNTPAVLGRAVTGLAGGASASAEDIARARTLFETVGTVLQVPENKMDALSTISGSGPAYVFYLVEQLTSTAVDLGFSASEAATMVNQTFLGAAELLAASDVGPAELRRRVTSPHGTTERAIGVLESANLKHLFDRATASALARAKELAT